MTERVSKEIHLLRTKYPDLEVSPDGNWVMLHKYPLSSGWSKDLTDIVFQIPVSYPGSPPYGILTPSRLLFDGLQPDNYVQASGNIPPFSGEWWIFSWQPADGEWKPGSEPIRGSNLLNWVMGFKTRFQEGK